MLDRLSACREVRALEEEQRQGKGLGDVRRQEDDVTRHEFEPGLVTERDHAAHRADHPELPVAPGGGRREGPAAGVAVEPSLLHEDVERLPNRRPAHVEARAERVLGRDALALVAQVKADGFGDLEIPRNAGTVVHAWRPPAVRMSRHLPPELAAVKFLPQFGVRGEDVIGEAASSARIIATALSSSLPTADAAASGRASSARELAGDDEALDLVGALVDLG